MAEASRRQKRAVYQSPLREEQTQQTGERILEALVDHLAEQGWETFSIAKVAERAGVSEPTVYRHFPNREAMIAALATWHEERMAFPSTPASVDEMPALAHALFDHFQDNATLVRAKLHASVGREVREPGRKKRDQRTRALFAEAFNHLTPAETRAASAVLRVLISGDSWDAMTQRLEIEPVAASAAVAWATRALIDAARRDKKLGRHTLVPPETIALANAMRERAHARRAGKKTK